MQLRHIVSTTQFLDTTVLNRLFAMANNLEAQDRWGSVPQVLKGKILATVFYEPSTRTRFSFEAAMNKLGGSVISTESAEQFSSVTKGETLQDTVRIIGAYADVIVLRHKVRGAAAQAAEVSSVPIINAGDGDGEHPTQALLDVWTIQKECGGISGLKVALVGDLKYGRTVHSLLHLLALYSGVHIFLVSPPSFALPEKDKRMLEQKGISFSEEQDLRTVLKEADVVYMTRLQKERMGSGDVPEQYGLTKQDVSLMKNNAIILHPLPRVSELPAEIDADHRAKYFDQARNGLYMRMALLCSVFNTG